MYNSDKLLEAFDNFVDTIKHKLTVNDLERYAKLKIQLKQPDQAIVEKAFADLIRWLLLLKDFFDKLP